MDSLVNNVPEFCILWTGTDNSNHVPYSYWMPNPSAISSAWLLKSARYSACFILICSMTEGTTLLLFGARWLLKWWLDEDALDDVVVLVAAAAASWLRLAALDVALVVELLLGVAVAVLVSSSNGVALSLMLGICSSRYAIMR